MSYEARVYQVMIASPDDVRDERKLASRIVLEWNIINSRKTGIVLLPALWETHTAPRMGERPQEIINKQLLELSDLLVGLFWTRIGTPTGQAISGTVEEIERHLAANKPAMLYFRDLPAAPKDIDKAQYEVLKKTQDQWRKRGLICEYTDPADFERKFRQQLSITLDTEPSFGVQEASERDTRRHAADITLSEDGQTLLLEGAQDRSGVILCARLDQGTVIRTNGKEFAVAGDPRSEAHWLDVIKELVGAGYIQDRGFQGMVYDLTDLGYRMADRIKQKLRT